MTNSPLVKYLSFLQKKKEKKGAEGGKRERENKKRLTRIRRGNISGKRPTTA